MKQNRRIAACILVSLSLVVACASTPNQIAYRTVGLTVHAVDTAMQIFADAYVAGKISQPNADKVRKAYTAYQDAAASAEVALESGSEVPTPPNLAKVSKALIDLVYQITGSKP